MSPQLMRFFTLVGIALAAARMQLKVRAAVPGESEVRQVQAFVAQKETR